MFDWIRSLFGRNNLTEAAKPTPKQQTSSKVNRQKDTAVAPPTPQIPSGEFVVTLQEDGLLPERIAETISRLMGIELSAAQKLTQTVPVVLSDGVAEAFAYKMQRELQMLGAVVDVSRGSGLAEDAVVETAVVPEPAPVPDTTTSHDDSILKTHVYQVFLTSLGPQPESVIEYIRSLLNDYETVRAVQWQTKMKMERKMPLVFGRTLEDANQIAAELNALGATAVVFRGNDPDKPKYDHNQYGLVLVDVGSNREEVVSLVAETADLEHRQAAQAIRELPLVLLEKVSVKKAIEFGERFNALGARCKLPGPAKQIWLDPSTDHIHKQPGDYRVILHRVGSNKLLVHKTIANLRPDLSIQKIKQLMDTVPQVLWNHINLETAELVKLKLEDFSATVVIQVETIALKSGEIHSQNPDFVPGAYDVVLTEFDRMQRIFLIKKLRDLLPGSSLKELVDLLELVPVVIVRGVNEETAVSIQETVAETSGVISIVLSDN